MLTQKQLKENLSYNPETGIFTRLKSNSNRVKIGDIAGYSGVNGYVSIRVLTTTYAAHRLAWLYVNGSFPANEIDHIDRCKSNNRMSNLRECDKFQNQCNTTSRRGARCKSKGVDFMRSKGKFRARMSVRGKAIHIGLYCTELEASNAYQEYAVTYHEGFGTTRSSANKSIQFENKKGN